MRKLIILFFFLSFLACLFLAILYIPIQVTRIYGAPTPALGIFQRIQYSALLLWYDGLLTRPLDSSGTEQ